MVNYIGLSCCKVPDTENIIENKVFKLKELLVVLRLILGFVKENVRILRCGVIICRVGLGHPDISSHIM